MVSVCGKSGVYTHGPGSTTTVHHSQVISRQATTPQPRRCPTNPPTYHRFIAPRTQQRNRQVTRCGRILVEVAHQAHVDATYCLLTKSGGGGVMVRHSGTEAILTRNVISDARLAGVDAREGCQVSLEMQTNRAKARTIRTTRTLTRTLVLAPTLTLTLAGILNSLPHPTPPHSTPLHPNLALELR